MSKELSTVTTVDQAHKSGAISIKPYFDPNMSNMGLEAYGMSLYDGVFHEEQLAVVEQNGIRRYLTGLNEFAPEVKLIEDEELRNARIKEIRTVVAQVERELATNVLDIKDKDFWSKVKLLKPDNDAYWGKVVIRCGNVPVNLDPKKDINDLVKLYAIEAGGFSMIAPSYEVARSMSVSPKFYLDKSYSTLATKNEITKLKNKALSELQTLFDTNTNKLLYVAKAVDANSVQYKKNTPNDVVYDNMDKFITGRGVETNLKRAAQSFLDASALDMETLKIKAVVKDATFYKYIAFKADGLIYHVESGSLLGRNVADCVEYLKNALNDSILQDLLRKVEKQWNQ